MKRKGDKVFCLDWGGAGSNEVVYGRDIAEAMNNAGYGGGAAGALKSWRRLDARSKKDKALIAEYESR